MPSTSMPSNAPSMASLPCVASVASMALRLPQRRTDPIRRGLFHYAYLVTDSVVLFASDLAWPGVVAVIAVVLLTTQRGPIGRLIERINSVKYPGGEVG